MKSIRWTLTTILILAGFVMTAQAQRPYRYTHEQVKALIERIEKGGDAFRDSLKEALKQSHFDQTRREDNVNQFVKDFEDATDRLKDNFKDDNTAVAAVEEVLRRGVIIDGFMDRHWLTQQAERDWRNLYRNLNDLARAYQVGWNQSGSIRPPYRISQENMKALMEQIEKGADRFRESLDNALDKSKFDGSNREDNINRYISDFEVTTDQLKDRFEDNYAASGAAGEVLRRAAWINQFMKRHSLTPRAQEDWASLRSRLDELGKAYSVSMNWSNATITFQ